MEGDGVGAGAEVPGLHVVNRLCVSEEGNMLPSVESILTSLFFSTPSIFPSIEKCFVI